MKWAFQIERTTLDHRNLSDLLCGIGYQVIDTPGLELVFSSEKIDNCANANEVWDEAKRVHDLVSNITGIDPELILGPVINLSSGEAKRLHFLEIQSSIIVLSSLPASLTVFPPAGLTEDELVEWNNYRAEQEYKSRLEEQRAKLEPAFREPRAVKVLKLLKLDTHTGESLYKIYELSEGHPSRRKDFQEQFGISKTDFRRFTDAVHNPVISGDLARHAYEDEPKTTNPMTIEEAKSFVFTIANRWLASLRG